MKIRTTCPKNNKYYIRTVTGGLNGAVAGEPTQKYANVLDNCVGYANGRFNEIWNDPDLKGIVKSFHVQLVCNAENFIESAKKQGLKVSSTPVVGGIMVWQRGATLSGNDGAGHVAVVERVYNDGTIMTSESGWASWAFKTVRRDNSNGRWGQNSAYKFRGCIINPNVKNVITPAPKLTIDGNGGACTVRAMQRFFGTVQDGVISGQSKAQNKYYPALKAVEYGTGGSTCIKKLQKWVGTSQDGVLGENTVKAWQKKIGVASDGVFGTNSMKAWQKYLNENEKAVYPTVAEEKYYKVIDVSDWQGSIDWNKVKADGIVGAIIRYADGTTLDKRFAENMKNAKAAGVHIGSYIFSRAKTKAEAEAEATRLYNACKPYSPDMPLYIDLEASTLAKYANTVAQAFLTKMKALGGRGGVYANLNWWNNYLVDTAKNYSANPFWIAQYNSTMDYKPASKMGMWQYSSSGKVNGISGKVDMDKCYVAYWEKPSTNEPKSIGSLANEYAYTTNASEAKYNGGAPTEAYKNGLDKAYPNRSSWGTAPRKGASCDVFVGTCVRNAGVDANFPRGLADQIPYLAKSDKFEEVSVTASTAKDGDIIIYTKTAGGGHVCIVYGGKIKEAGFESYYPKTTDTLKTRLSTTGKNWVKVYRVAPSLTEKELEACKVQAEWMKNSKYKWQANPTIAKSKTYGTCVTYVACVLQRIGYLASGKCIWHNKKGEVYGATNKMTVIYPKNKMLSQLKSELKAGDIVMDGNKADLESGSHIFILTGEWSGNKPIIWDNHSAQQKGGKSYVYSRNRNVIAIVRLK